MFLFVYIHVKYYEQCIFGIIQTLLEIETTKSALILPFSTKNVPFYFENFLNAASMDGTMVLESINFDEVLWFFLRQFVCIFLINNKQ